MPLVHKEGKDTIIFATKEDHQTPSTVDLPEPESSPSLLLPNGEINWNCPCLGGMATGPCGLEFREAFSCFHFSTADPKGSDCFEAFKTMQMCMSEYPSLYGNNEANMDDLNEEVEADEEAESSRKSKDDTKAISSAEKHSDAKTEKTPDSSSSKKEVERAKSN